MGSIALRVVLGKKPQRVDVMVDFLVVDLPFGFNVILGGPTLNVVRAVPSTFHLKMRFPTSNGVGKVHGDQIAAQS